MTYICFCKPDTMSRCVATSLSEQQQCHFFAKSMNADRCMNLNQGMNFHCWSEKAQDNGLCLPGDPRAYEEESFTEDEIEEMLAGSDIEIRDCHKCINFACSYVIKANKNKPGGLTVSDFKKIATACGEFVADDIPY